MAIGSRSSTRSPFPPVLWRSGLPVPLVGMEGEHFIGNALRVRRREENLLAVRAQRFE